LATSPSAGRSSATTYRNLANAKHEESDENGNRARMRPAAAVVVGEVYDENVETVDRRTPSQIFPLKHP